MDWLLVWEASPHFLHQVIAEACSDLKRATMELTWHRKLGFTGSHVCLAVRTQRETSNKACFIFGHFPFGSDRFGIPRTEIASSAGMNSRIHKTPAFKKHHTLQFLILALSSSNDSRTRRSNNICRSRVRSGRYKRKQDEQRKTKQTHMYIL